MANYQKQRLQKNPVKIKGHLTNEAAFYFTIEYLMQYELFIIRILD